MFKFVSEVPEGALLLGEGVFTAKEENPALAKVLFQISQGEYVVRMLTSHLHSILKNTPELINRVENAQLFYTLGEARPHPDKVHILVPFQTYYLPNQ